MLKIQQPDIDKIVARAKELGAGEGLVHKQGLFQLKGYEKPWTWEVVAGVLVNGWHGKYELIAAMQAALEHVEERYLDNNGNAYGNGVTAGKKEALGYKPDEKDAWINHAAYAEGYREGKEVLQNQLDSMDQAYAILRDQHSEATQNVANLQARLDAASASRLEEPDRNEAETEGPTEASVLRSALEQMTPGSVAQMKIKDDALKFGKS